MIRVRCATRADLANLDLEEGTYQEYARGVLLRNPEAADEILSHFGFAAVQGEEVLAVGGYAPDGATWVFLSRALRERGQHRVFGIVRRMNAAFLAETGVSPYSVPDAEEPRAPRVARACGFVDVGEERWVWRQR